MLRHDLCGYHRSGTETAVAGAPVVAIAGRTCSARQAGLRNPYGVQRSAARWSQRSSHSVLQQKTSSAQTATQHGSLGSARQTHFCPHASRQHSGAVVQTSLHVFSSLQPATGLSTPGTATTSHALFRGVSVVPQLSPQIPAASSAQKPSHVSTQQNGSTAHTRLQQLSSLHPARPLSASQAPALVEQAGNDPVHSP